MKTETYLPIFSGFYNTIFEFDYSSIEYDIQNERKQNGLYSDFDHLKIDNEKYENDIVTSFCHVLKSELSEYIFNIELENIVHPKAYNFSNDSANVTIKYNAEKILFEFYFRKENNSYRNICKKCWVKNSLIYVKRNKKSVAKRKNSWYLKNKIRILKKLKYRNKKSPWIFTLTLIKQRCTNPKTIHWHRYGGRGIKCFLTIDKIKKLWFRDKAYEMKKPSIDRINNDGNYCLKNCRFIEQRENSRKGMIEYWKNKRTIK